MAHRSSILINSLLLGISVFFLPIGSSLGNSYPQIDQLIESGEIYVALELTRKELSDNAKDPFLLETAGKLSFQVGDYDKGSEYFRNLFHISSEPAAVLVKLACAQEDASLHESASEAARQAIRLNPEVAGARAVLARCLLAGLHHEEARDLLASEIKKGSRDPEELLAYGRALIGTGEFTEAVSIFRRALEAGAVDLETCLSYGEALSGNRDYREAADVLATVLEKDPGIVKGYYLLGTALMRLGRREAADPLLETYRSMHNLEEQWYFLDMEAAGFRNQTAYERALLHSHRGQYHRALTGFRAAAALKPIDGAVVLSAAAQMADLEAIQEAQEILDRAMARGVKPEADFFYQKGEIFRLAGQFQDAQLWLQKALNADPEHTGALLKMGQVLLESPQSTQKAGTFLSQAREKAPDHWEPAYWLGRVALLQGNTKLARSTLEKAAELLEGGNPQILSALGLNELQAGSTEEGSRFLLESMKLDRTIPETLGGLAEGLKALGDPLGAAKAGDMKREAEKIRRLTLECRSSQQPFEKKGSAFLRIANIYKELGSPTHTVKYLRLARAASPDMTEPYRALAEMATAPGECFFRANNLGNILRLNPEDGSAARGLAALYSQLGVRLRRGVELARLSLRASNSAEGTCVLAELLFQLGELEAASREIETALEKRPNDKRLKVLAARLAKAAADALPKLGNNR